ncbi:hypothetical protein ACHAWF_009397 [Thalassiosira exigua]
MSDAPASPARSNGVGVGVGVGAAHTPSSGPVPPPFASPDVHARSPGEIERGDLHARKSKRTNAQRKSGGGRGGGGALRSPPSTSKPAKRPNSASGAGPRGERGRTALIKYGSLLLLVGQMVGLVLLMRYSRTHVNGELYLASTAVFVMEVAKFSICVCVILYQSNLSPKALRAELHEHVWASPLEMLKLCVPSFLYTVQNNLLYLALTNLDAATYQILYQLKILTTAVFSATMLGRRFSAAKWASLVVLTIGVAIVQASGSTDREASIDEDRNRAAGLAAVLCAACTSGFSGVYFEKILKGSDVSLWMRNVQMGVPSMFLALATVFAEDAAEVSRKGFFVGYSPTVAAVIAVQAAGGLIVAVVVKYADNVLKVFASSFSILLSCAISAIAFDFRPNAPFLFGACLVILSTVMYSKPPSKRQGLLHQRGQPLPIISHRGVRKTSLVM